jgi:transmembrane sensor
MKSASERLAQHFSSRAPREEEDLDVAWRGIARRRTKEKRRARSLRAASVLLVIAITVLLGKRWSDRPLAGTTGTVAVLPIAFATGAPLSGSLEGQVALDDGSRLDIQPGTELAVKASAAAEVRFELARGNVTFDVRPGGVRAWSIDAGQVVVRVVGTRFSVARDGARVDVAVEHGVVAVLSPRLSGGARTLGAGQSVRIEDPGPTSAAPAAPNSDRGHEPPARLPPAVAPKSPRSLATADAPQPPGDPDDAMARADDARREGKPREAAALLLPIASSSDRRASLAAFTLGKITSADLHDEGAAARWFERASDLGLPNGLAEEALARAAESYARAGARDAARRVADRYRQKFPDGRHRGRIETWSRD